MQSPSFPCYLVPPRSKYSPQHHVPKHPQFPFLPQCQRPSFTPIHNLLLTLLTAIELSLGGSSGRKVGTITGDLVDGGTKDEAIAFNFAGTD